MFNLYNHIENLAKEHGYQTIEELCKSAGVWNTAMSNLKAKGENGTISLKTASKFANVLNVSVDTIYGRTTEKTATSGDGQQINFNELSEKDKRLIEWFRSLSEEKQKAILISQDAPKDLF